MGARQLKLGLRVADLDRSCAFYRRLGFRQIPEQDQPGMRYLTYGHTWLMLSARSDHGYHHEERGELTRGGRSGTAWCWSCPPPTWMRRTDSGGTRV